MGLFKDIVAAYLKAQADIAEQRSRDTRANTWNMRATVVIALFTIASVTVAAVQCSSMQGQLNVLKAQIAPRLFLKIDFSQTRPDRFLTPVWTNSGDAEPQQFEGWAVIEVGDRRATHPSFISLDKSGENKFEQQSVRITEEQARAVSGRKVTAIIRGAIRYAPFPGDEVQTMTWCRELYILPDLTKATTFSDTPACNAHRP